MPHRPDSAFFAAARYDREFEDEIMMFFTAIISDTFEKFEELEKKQ